MSENVEQEVTETADAKEVKEVKRFIFELSKDKKLSIKSENNEQIKLSDVAQIIDILLTNVVLSLKEQDKDLMKTYIDGLKNSLDNI